MNRVVVKSDIGQSGSAHKIQVGPMTIRLAYCYVVWCLILELGRRSAKAN